MSVSSEDKISKKRPRDDSLYSILECPICMEVFTPPVYQCTKGHLICNQCKRQIRDTCPSCRARLGDIRNLAIEKLMETIPTPCRYSDRGCTVEEVLPERQIHERNCEFRPWTCPLPRRCEWQGYCEDVSSHLINHHQKQVLRGPTIDWKCILDPNRTKDGHWAAVYEHENICCLLFLRQIIRLDQYHAYIRMISADPTPYELRISNNNTCLSWKGVAKTIREDRDIELATHDCMVCYTSVANSMAVNDEESRPVLRISGWVGTEYKEEAEQRLLLGISTKAKETKETKNSVEQSPSSVGTITPPVTRSRSNRDSL